MKIWIRYESPVYLYKVDLEVSFCNNAFMCIIIFNELFRYHFFLFYLMYMFLEKVFIHIEKESIMK